MLIPERAETFVQVHLALIAVQILEESEEDVLELNIVAKLGGALLDLARYELL